MRATIALILILVMLSFVTGCGPGQPFEIESQNTSEPGAVAAAP